MISATFEIITSLSLCIILNINLYFNSRRFIYGIVIYAGIFVMTPTNHMLLPRGFCERIIALELEILHKA